MLKRRPGTHPAHSCPRVPAGLAVPMKPTVTHGDPTSSGVPRHPAAGYKGSSGGTGRGPMPHPAEAQEGPARLGPDPHTVPSAGNALMEIQARLCPSPSPGATLLGEVPHNPSTQDGNHIASRSPCWAPSGPPRL